MTAANASSTNMNSTELVRNRTNRHARPHCESERHAAPRFTTELIGPTRQAILRARQHLVSEQRRDGLWLGLQITDASLPSLLVFWLAYSDQSNSELAQQAAAAILDRQLPEGGWPHKPGGPADLSISVQAYFALKLVGIDPTSATLARGREVIRQLGGADAADTATRRVLALFGQVGLDVYSHEPWLQRAVRPVEIERGVRELFLRRPADWPALNDAPNPPGPQDTGAAPEQLCFDALVWRMIAEMGSDIPASAATFAELEARLREMIVIDEDETAAWPQHDPQPIADTGLVAAVLMTSGLSPDHYALKAALQHIYRMERSDIRSLRTAQLCHILSTVQLAAAPSSETTVLPPEFDFFDGRDGDSVESLASSLPHGQSTATRRESLADLSADPVYVGQQAMFDELLRRQNPDGGWSDGKGAPSDSAATGSVLEAIVACDDSRARDAVDRAVAFLLVAQEGDGRWLSATSANAILTTSAAIRGLLAAGAALDDDAVAAAMNWLVVEQRHDGGWQENTAESCALPTAGALLAFVAAGKLNHRSCRRAVEFLIDAQQERGDWSNAGHAMHDTITNRWMQCALHATVWPLQALSHWALAASSEQLEPAEELSLRLVGAAADE